MNDTGRAASTRVTRHCSQCFGRVVSALLIASLVLGLEVPVSVAAGPDFPPLTGRIVDAAGLVSAEDRAAIETELQKLEAQSSDQIAVVTLRSLEGYEIEDYGYRLGRHWGIGQKEKDNGAILIVAPNERNVRIEVGRGLEPHLTDAMSRLIIERTILPAFRRGDFSGGIRAGVRDMKDVVLGDAEAVKERARDTGGGPGPDWIALLFIAIWIAIFVYVIYAQYRHAQQSPASMGRTRRARSRSLENDGFIVIPGGSGHWDRGGWDSGGRGGWSGGGGSFGGGGASGRW